MAAAMDNASEGITIADAAKPDMPLVYVNKGFLRMTGYTADEVLHRNCRFLQGTDHDQPNVALLRDAIAGQRAVQVELVNYRKDGTLFYNRLSLTPLFDEGGTLTHYVGVQEDITALRQKEEAARRLAQATLVQRLTEQIRQDERDALGKELHDNINQLLATSRLLLNVSAESYAQQKDLMQNSSRLLTDAIEEIRKLSHRLVEPRFEHESLRAALTQLVQNLEPALPFSLSLAFLLDEEALDDARRLLLYRVVQEGVNNSIKYANPSHLSIRLQAHKGSVELCLEDDGAGFDPRRFAEGIGLRNLRSRVQQEGGSFDVVSAPGRGCRLHVTLPAVNKGQ